jgi:hypothetical protein
MAQPISAFPIPPEGTGQVEARPPLPRSRTKQFPVSSSSAARRPRQGVIQHSFQTARSVFSRSMLDLSRRVRDFANDRPLRLLAGIAAVAFLAGAALRVWRSGRYE